MNLGHPEKRRHFGVPQQTWMLSVNTAYKVKAGALRKGITLISTGPAYCAGKQSKFCLFLVSLSYMFFLLTLLNTQYLVNAKVFFFPFHWEVGDEVC